MEPNNPSDPWSFDYFNPTPPKPGTPGVSPRIHPEKPKMPEVPTAIPDVDRLFQVQRSLLVGLGALEAGNEKHAEQDFENAYRVLRTWLKNHG